MPYNRIRDHGAVHDLLDLVHVEIERVLSHFLKIVLNAHIDNERARGNEMARLNKLSQSDLIANIVEDRTQGFLVASVGSSCQPEEQ